MIQTVKGTVREIIRNDGDIQELVADIEGKGAKAINYPGLTGAVKAGDEIVLNITAVSLGLGTGGAHFVMHCPANDVHRELSENQHIMKLRYTPMQIAAGSCEEQGSPHHEILKVNSSIEGMPVLVGELHSMLPIAVTYIKHKNSQIRIAYIMSDSAGLPLPLSGHVKALKELGWLAGTITIGQAFGGDLEAVNIYSALIAARHILQADLAIVAMGPGIVGTGTPLGFSGMDQVAHLHAALSTEGTPIAIPRVSQRDRRNRHQGLSHHTMQILRHTLVPIFLPLLEEIEIPNQAGFIHHILRKSKHKLPDLEQVLAGYPIPIQTMGRGIQEEPLFFYSVALAADFACFLSGQTNGRDDAGILAPLWLDSSIL